MTDAPKLLLSAKEAAAALSISPRLLWSLSISGEMPSLKIRTRRLYDPADLAEWIEGQKQGTKQ